MGYQITFVVFTVFHGLPHSSLTQDILSPFTFLMIHMPEDAAVERAAKSSGKVDLDLDERYAAQRAKRQGLQRTFQLCYTWIPVYR